MEKNHDWADQTSVEALKKSFEFHLKYSLADDHLSATKRDLYNSLALSVRDRLIKKWLQCQHSYYENDAKRVYYLSMEFLVGRLLNNSLINLGFYDEFCQALKELGYDMGELEEMEIEAGLGNGGLGRLASCFMESLATLGVPVWGYGIRYEFGIFFQKIINGFQVETADNWLRSGSPWEIPRPRFLYPVHFEGRVETSLNQKGEPEYKWVDTSRVVAMPFDIPVPGYKNQTVNNLRLWGARSDLELDLKLFNKGDYFEAMRDKHNTEIISKVLYPSDANRNGKKLRLKQEYFFVSASLQDIIRRFKKAHSDFSLFPEKVAIQMNDTHPALAVADLMRILIDEERLSWGQAWDITVKTFGFTNHTILPEALEKWPLDLMEELLPRHLQIIFKINDHLLKEVREKFPDDIERIRRMSLVEEGFSKSLRMAHLAIVGSHSLNGVAEIHSDILKKDVFKDFYDIYPERFNNKTNGITQRRWLKACNPGLSILINKTIGDGWVKDLTELQSLKQKKDDPGFRNKWRLVKRENKQKLAKLIQDRVGITVNQESIFDVHIKRFHEYKRQLLNILHCIILRNRLIKNPESVTGSYTKIFAGKAAPGYAMAKLIIKLANAIGEKVNYDPEIGDRLKIVFIPNYSVSVAEVIIPGSDLSEQISTAGMEASGTGNMKLALNGALTIGTLDGANVEILREVGEENIFIFGLTAEEVKKKKQENFDPRDIYLNNKEIKEAVDQIGNGFFSSESPELFQPITDYFFIQNDPYMVLADLESYIQSHEKAAKEFQDADSWTEKSILNTANMGFFSSDRSVAEYSKDVWGIDPANPLSSTTRLVNQES
ncbi:MAG: glycogen/starch/alpha-glucan phosphorylase [Nitrospinae bacterium]|nr:glycogen/starch/alpha-glucan phosphorylase [Nitrospinota bacterium]MZH13610.1 glycogen/starch/alpha-glucan phosphorylase [Nitrospinota bacterium]